MCIYVNSQPFPLAACADALGIEGYAVYMLTSGDSMVFTNRSLVEYVLDSSARGITTYLALKYCLCLTCFVTRVTRSCDFGRGRSFGKLDPREWR